MYTCNSLISGRKFDLGAFVVDDWNSRPNITVILGLRYETQNNIHDWRDFAPRICLAWAPGGASGKARSKSVIRAGFGMFYVRFRLARTLTPQPYNGVVHHPYILANPELFPTVPP